MDRVGSHAGLSGPESGIAMLRGPDMRFALIGKSFPSASALEFHPSAERVVLQQAFLSTRSDARHTDPASGSPSRHDPHAPATLDDFQARLRPAVFRRGAISLLVAVGVLLLLMIVGIGSTRRSS